MNSTQYTIRSVPSKVDRALRDRARRSGKSLNQTVVEVLKQAVGVTDEPVIYHDLDWFFCRRRLGNEFDRSQEWLESLPKDMDERP